MSCPKLPRILLQWQLGTPLIISTETGPVSSACIAAISPVHAADMSFAPEVAPHSYVAFSQFDAAPVNSDGVFTFLGSDHDGNAIDAGSDDIKVGCLTRHLVADRSPAQRLLIALVLPPLICLLYFVVPLSGSWTAAPTSLMSFYAYSLWFEPLYIAGGFVVSSLFFTFSVQRFRAWVYLSMWVFAVLVTAIFSLSLGRDGLHQNRIINWYTQIWTSGLILLAKFISCAYLHLHNGSPSALFFELADVERCHASLPVSADDSTAGTTTSAASPRPLSASATLPLPLASASDCDTAQTAFVAVDSEQVCTRREFNHLAQFALSVILNVIGVSSYILCTYLAIQKFTDTNGDFAAQTKFYIAFQIAFIVLRYLNLYVVGLFRRRNFATYGDVSVVYMYTHHVFFFTFYRVLFSSVTGVGEFVTILVLQVVADIALYIGLVMRPVHRLVRHAKLWVWSLLMRAGMYTVASFRSCCGSPSADATTAPFDEQFERELMRYYRERDDSDAREADLNEAIRGNSEDSLVRAIALVCTYASYVAVNMAIRFTPTIRAHYPESSDTDFAKLQVFLVIAMVVKLATTAAIEMYLRLQRVGNMGIWSKWSEFSANIEHLLVICAITVHITSDVFVPNVKMCFDIARCT